MTPVAETLRVHVNDTDRTVPQGARLLSLLDEMSLAGRLGLAVALNAAVVPRAHWADKELQEGDRILIIQASQGG
jgi:sulfur carrier protein